MAWAGPGEAATSAWQRTDFSAVRLISAADSVGPGGDLVLGVQFTLAPTWHIYWRAPGEAGLPPAYDWSGSENLSAPAVSWPLPERYELQGFHTLGYADEVVFPISARAPQPGQGVKLRLAVDYQACSNICVPVHTTLALDLAAGDGAPGAETHLIDRFRARVPGPPGAMGLRVEGLRAVTVGGKTVVRVAVRSDVALRRPDALIEGPKELLFAPPRIEPTGDPRLTVLEVPLFVREDLGRPLDGLPLRVTLIDGSDGRETPRSNQSIAAIGSGRVPEASAFAGSLLAILAIAVVGGLILNLMPCVLPVLSIKLLGVVGHGGGDPRQVRLGFLASAAGILFSFLLLAAGVAAAKAAGATVGWGIQFQNPWFLALMAVIITLFACNLWGLFEFHLPRWAAEAGARGSHVNGMGGHFLSGALATLLATPCSAPFLGTAVSFALARGGGQIFAVFTALGLGLALPYLLVALRPSLATRLPKPGPWMVHLRKVLGLALAATTAWLLWVLSSHTALWPVLAIGGLLVALALALARLRGRPRPAMGLIALATLLVLLVPALPGAQSAAPGLLDKKALAGIWQPFQRSRIAPLVAGGRSVFVDVTADWCITCQVNKALVLARAEVHARLTAPGVIAMQADWTLPNQAIADYLADNGRYGIPFNAVYGPAAPRGILLPELLDIKSVLKALDQAAGGGNISTR